MGLLLLSVGFFMAQPVMAQNNGDGGDPERGAELYAANCAVCHGAQGEGRVGAELNDVFVSMNPDVQLTQIITNGRPNTFMPAWGEANDGPLSETDVADIVAYIESWGTTYEPPAPVPPVPTTPIPPAPDVTGDPNVGYGIYQQNCAACHGASGEGRVGSEINTTFAAIDPEAFAISTISNGRADTLMPAWAQSKGGPLTDGEINDVAAYVLSVQHAKPVPAGEQVQKANGLPLLLAGAAVLIVIVALGVSVNRRSSSK
jgi:mono/diheme cytochrome c family protein